jgi:hypothetical protein
MGRGGPDLSSRSLLSALREGPGADFRVPGMRMTDLSHGRMGEEREMEWVARIKRRNSLITGQAWTPNSKILSSLSSHFSKNRKTRIYKTGFHLFVLLVCLSKIYFMLGSYL